MLSLTAVWGRGRQQGRRTLSTRLGGITVFDFGQIYQVLYATMLAAKAGVTVIKIELPAGSPTPKGADER